MILYVINSMLKDKALAQTGLSRLKEAFAIFADNQQIHPLVYERASTPQIDTGPMASLTWHRRLGRRSIVGIVHDGE
jgi:endoglucanase Acf2